MLQVPSWSTQQAQTQAVYTKEGFRVEVVEIDHKLASCQQAGKECIIRPSIVPIIAGQ